MTDSKKSLNKCECSYLRVSECGVDLCNVYPPAEKKRKKVYMYQDKYTSCIPTSLYPFALANSIEKNMQVTGFQ